MQTDGRERNHFKTCLCRSCLTYVYVLNPEYPEYFTGGSNIWYVHVKWVIWQIRVSVILFFNSFESGVSLKPRELFVLKLSATERSGVFMAVDRKPRVIQRVTPPPRSASCLIKGDTEIQRGVTRYMWELFWGVLAQISDIWPKAKTPCNQPKAFFLRLIMGPKELDENHKWDYNLLLFCSTLL